MSDPRFQIETIDVSEVGERLKKPLKQVVRNKARVVVEQNGKVVAAVISALDYERLQMLDRRAADGWRAIERIHALNADKDPEEVERDVAEAIEEIRAERRARAAVTPTT